MSSQVRSSILLEVTFSIYPSDTWAVTRSMSVSARILTYTVALFWLQFRRTSWTTRPALTWWSGRERTWRSDALRRAHPSPASPGVARGARPSPWATGRRVGNFIQHLLRVFTCYSVLRRQITDTEGGGEGEIVTPSMIYPNLIH